jgi:MFS superfamily sulfate permease-like transporter
VIPLISQSALSVSGPAAGLIAIVLFEMQRLGGVNALMTAVALAGAMQIAFGLLRTGKFSALVPGSVVKGMLAAIGITITLKQLPVLFGATGGLLAISGTLHPGATLIGTASLAVLLGWRYTPLARLSLVPPALVVVVAASLAASFLKGEGWLLETRHLVNVPNTGMEGLRAALPVPDWSVLGSTAVWIAATTIAVVASIETLLSCQAVDRLDPLKRRTPPDRELIAQGVGNLLSGALGGLPITSVIVRSGANVAAGGRGRLAAVVHALLLLGCVLLLPDVLNRIPQPCLAAILIQVGLNLAKPSLLLEQRRLGLDQFIPCLVTIGAVLATDLLKGVLLGMGVGVFLALRKTATSSLEWMDQADGSIVLRLRRDGTFLIKPALVEAFAKIPSGARVTFDANGEPVDQDVKEAIASFVDDALNRDIHVQLLGVDLAGVTAGGGH